MNQIGTVEEIQINDPGAVPRMVFRPSHCSLNRLKPTMKLCRGEVRSDFEDSIKEGLRSLRAVDRGGFVDFGTGDGNVSRVEIEDPTPRGLKVQKAGFDVGAECNSRPHRI